MKSKYLMLFATVAASCVATATVISSNTLCRIEVNSGQTNTIVSVPLVKTGENTDVNVVLSSLVQTNNFVTGDMLLRWNGASWDAWCMVEGTGWEPTIITAGGSSYSKTKPAADTALARGDAFWVVREGVGADLTKPFYIYGQVALGAFGTKSIAKGSPEEPAYTLIGNPKLGALDLNDNLTWSNCGPNDKIVVASSVSATGYKEYQWATVDNTPCWAYRAKTGTTTVAGHEVTVTGWVKATDDIPAGVGVWYVSQSDTDKTPTVTFN